MGRDTDFEFGWNEADNLDPPWSAGPGRASAGTGRRTAQQASAVPASEDEDWRSEETCEYVLKQVRLITQTVRKANRVKNMDLSSYKGNGRSGGSSFENRDWIESTDLPKKGSSKWKIDLFREAKKKGKAIGYIDLSNGSKKRVMSLRKGFTLDAMIDKLGPNTDRWKGKTIDLERGGSDGQYVNVAQ